MGKVILKNTKIEVDGADLSKRARSVTINTNADDVDVSCFQGGGFHEHANGLRDATFTIGFIQDQEVGMVDATLWPLAIADTHFPVTVTDLDSPGSDPFHMTAILQDYSPLAGNLGEASTTDVTFQNASSDGIERVAS